MCCDLSQACTEAPALTSRYVLLAGLCIKIPYDLTRGHAYSLQVYKGRRKGTGQTVAMKFILKHGKSQKDIVSLRQEIDILRGLRHENIIQMLDSFETDQEFCVVTEFAQGRPHASSLLAGARLRVEIPVSGGLCVCMHASPEPWYGYREASHLESGFSPETNIACRRRRAV